MKEGRKPEYPEKTPGDQLQKASVYQERICADKLSLYVLYHTISHELCGCEVKDVHGLQSFVSTLFFFFFFFCVPQLYLWGSPLLGEIFAYVTVF